MAFFAGASNVAIYGGSFVNNAVNGNLTLADHSRHTNNLNSNNRSTNNVINSHNDNSTRISGSHRDGDEEMRSMPSRSAGYREEDRTRPLPQHPRFNPTQIPSTGGTATNINSFNMENMNITGAFNNNSKTYYQGGAPPDNRNNGPKWGPNHDGEGLSYTSGPHGSGQFKAPVEVPLQAAFPQQMGFGGPPSSHMSANGGNIQQLDQHMGQNLERFLKSALSQTVQSTSMTAGVSGGNHKPQATYSSSSRNVEGSDSMNTGMANLSLNDLHPPHPTSFPSDCQIGLKLTDQMSMGSLNPSTSWSPYINAVQQGSHYNPSLAPHMNDPNMVNLFPLPTETPQYGNNPNRLPPPPASTSPLNPPYGNNPNRPPSPPASTSPFNFPPSFSGAPDSNIHNGNLNIRDRSVHRSNVDSFNEKNNTIQDSYNDNSLVDFTGKHSATQSNKRRGFPDRSPDRNVPLKTRKEKNNPDPNRMDEELSSDEIDEQIPTAAERTVDSSGEKKKKWRPFFSRKKGS